MPRAKQPRPKQRSTPGRKARTGKGPQARSRSRPSPSLGELRRSRLILLGAVIASALVLVAWFPATSLLSQRSNLAASESQLSSLHKQDAALAQEKKNLSDAGEIGRIAREQYQFVTPGQRAYEVLPPTGSAAAKTPYAGDPGSNGPVTPSATSELPPGGVTTTTTAGSSGAKQQVAPSSGSGGFLSRVANTLEFWR